MGKLMKDDLFDAQLRRALGFAPYGGADLGECLAVAGRIRGTDVDAWQREWSALAQRLETYAESRANAGRPLSARNAFLRASNYWRTAGLFLLQSPIEERLVQTHGHEVACFRRGTALLERPPDVLEIPYQQGSLPAYFFPAAGDGTPRPTLILTTGYDGTAEELYFSSGRAALERGYHVLAFDGPGQGAMLIDRRVPIRRDWEQVITPVVDYLLGRPDVDGKRIGLSGLSLGGYLAPRAATAEHRLAACISDCGPYDVFAVTARRLPGILARQLPNGNQALLGALDRLVRGFMRKPTAGWAMRRNLLVHHLDDPLAYFRAAQAFSLRGLEDRIQCPTFVGSAETDDLSVEAPLLYAALRCPKAYRLFTAAEGAGEHCEGAARTLFNQVALDWLDSILEPAPAVTAAG